MHKDRLLRSENTREREFITIWMWEFALLRRNHTNMRDEVHVGVNNKSEHIIFKNELSVPFLFILLLPMRRLEKICSPYL